MRLRGWCWPWSNITRSDMVKVWHTNISSSPKNPGPTIQKKNVHNQEGDNIHINETVSDISKYRLLLTRWFLGTDENVGWLRQPLHELGDALRVVLTLAQRTHHGTEDTANDAREQLRVEGFSCCCCARIRCWVGPCPGCWSGTRGRRGWWKDGLGGLEIKWKQYVGV